MSLRLKSENLYDQIFFLSVTILLIQLNVRHLNEGGVTWIFWSTYYSALKKRAIEVILESVETTLIRFFNWLTYIEKYMYYLLLHLKSNIAKFKMKNWMTSSSYLQIYFSENHQAKRAARMLRSFFLSLEKND